MPSYKKGRIGSRQKNYSKKKKEKLALSTRSHILLDHSYSSTQPTVLDPAASTPLDSASLTQPTPLDSAASEDWLWQQSWDSFFIETCESGGEQRYHQHCDTNNDIADEYYVVLDTLYRYDPDDNVDDFVKGLSYHAKYLEFRTLRRELLHCEGEFDQFSILHNRKDIISILQFYEGDDLAVKLSVTIDPSFKATIRVHRQEIGYSHDFWIGLPVKYSTVTDVKKLLSKLSHHQVCVGNFEDKFAEIIPIGTGISHGSESSILAYREGDFAAHVNGLSYQSTIRSTKCQFLIPGNGRCSHCNRYRATLRKRVNRTSLSPKPQPESTFKINRKTHRHMTKTELVNKFELVRSQKNSLQSELDRLKRDVSRAIKQKGHTLTGTTSDDFHLILKEHCAEVRKSFPDEQSVQRLFWDQQLKYAQLNNKRSMRWHPMVIKWCLYMRNKSRKAYDAARNSGFINLPSKRTLFDYSHALPSTLGFHPGYSKHLMEEAGSLEMLNDDARSYVGILQDEVKVSEGLVYDRNSGELVGYVELDKTGNELLNLEEIIKGTKPQLANTMLVVMVRGIVTDLRYPFAAFATRGIVAEYIYTVIWETVMVLENLGLKPLFVTCDGASANRRFFSLHYVPELDNIHWTWNPYAYPERKLYFISDVPHLLKTTRNCFANSWSHKKTRNLWKHGYDISWMHIVRFYEEHIENNLYCKTYKLTRDHIDLTPYSTMKVNLAAQIFSSTVANALEDLYGNNVSETVKFIRHMNRFFDCLNTRSLREGMMTRNQDMVEYRDVNDNRLHYLMNDFFGFFQTVGGKCDGSARRIFIDTKETHVAQPSNIKGLKYFCKVNCGMCAVYAWCWCKLCVDTQVQPGPA